MSSIKSNPTYISILSAIQNLEEMGGVKDTNEYIAILRQVETDINGLIYNANVSENFVGARLSDNTRDAICKYLAEVKSSCEFGDGMEESYIWDGCNMPGLNNMTDYELVEEYENTIDAASYADDPDDQTDDDNLLLRKAKAELGIEEMIRG